LKVNSGVSKATLLFPPVPKMVEVAEEEEEEEEEADGAAEMTVRVAVVTGTDETTVRVEVVVAGAETTTVPEDPRLLVAEDDEVSRLPDDDPPKEVETVLLMNGVN